MALKKRKISIITSLLILASISLIGCNKKNIDISASDTPDIPKVKKESVTLSFAGDVTMGNYIGSTGEATFDGEFKKQNGDASYFFKNVKSIFEKDDISIVNLEGPLTNATVGNKEKQFAFKGDPAYVNILKEGNIEAVSIANNHSLDYFSEGLEDTKAILKQNNIKYSGMGEHSILKAKGIKIGFLAYNGWSYDNNLLNSIKSDIEKLKSQTNMIVVYYHWGEEMVNYPNQTQKKLAHFTIDNGADLVMGSHPHVLQGIEKYKNPEGEEKVIAYSLSNFSFGGNKNPADKDSMIFQQTFNFEDGKLVSSNEPVIIPCSISSTKSRNNYQPTPLEGDEKERVLNRIKEYSKNL